MKLHWRSPTSTIEFVLYREIETYCVLYSEPSFTKKVPLYFTHMFYFEYVVNIIGS